MLVAYKENRTEIENLVLVFEPDQTLLVKSK